MYRPRSVVLVPRYTDVQPTWSFSSHVKTKCYVLQVCNCNNQNLFTLFSSLPRASSLSSPSIGAVLCQRSDTKLNCNDLMTSLSLTEFQRSTKFQIPYLLSIIIRT